MKYSSIEAKVTQVGSVVSSAEKDLDQLLNTAKETLDYIDRALAGAGGIEAELDTQAATGEELWFRLKARKDEIKADVLTTRAMAEAIVTAIETELGR